MHTRHDRDCLATRGYHHEWQQRRVAVLNGSLQGADAIKTASLDDCVPIIPQNGIAFVNSVVLPLTGKRVVHSS